MKAGIFGGTFVVLAVVVIILVSSLGGGKAGPGHNDFIVPSAAPAAITNALGSVPTSELSAAGNGATGVISPVGKVGSGDALVPLSGSPITQDHLPVLVYVGSEFCPYCAATRWPLTIALDRFGSFTGLDITASSPLDVYSSTRTLTYLHATYTSKYLVFSHTEELSNDCPASDVIINTSRDTAEPDWLSPPYICNGEAYKPLQTPPAFAAKLLSSIDSAKYFTSSAANGIPFIDFAGKYAESGAIYTPEVLHGASWSQIVKALQDPTAGIGGEVLAAANRYTALICKMTNGKPGSVCNASFVKSAEKALSS